MKPTRDATRKSRRPGAPILGIGLTVLLVGGACTGGGTSRTASSSPTSSGAAPSSSATIPQPPLDALNDRTLRRLAPESQRVDLSVPSFSDPTTITNPLFPIGDLQSALLVGQLHGEPWRAETTLLPQTKTVDWNGQQIEALQSQFVAYLDGRIFEVAVDLYAQADDGSVWYLGEDAFTYRNGRPVDTEGTWRAGLDGPPAMIMPGDPQVGDVYRTENIPGIVFEQVTVKTVGETVMGPTGPVDGAMVAQELHMDEVRLEDKYFAPGYGEFFSGSGRTFEATALAVPIDAISEPVPAELESLPTGATGVFDASRSGDWSAASAILDEMNTAWSAFRSDDVPKRLAAQMSDALDVLARAVGAGHARGISLAALAVGDAGLDLQLRYRPAVEIDLARLELWTRELEADAGAGDRAAAIGDVTTLEWIRDRIALDAVDASRVDDQLRLLEAETQAGELTAVGDHAALLRETLAAIEATT